MNIASTATPSSLLSHSGQLCCSDNLKSLQVLRTNPRIQWLAHPFHYRHWKEKNTDFTNCAALFVQIQFAVLPATLTVRLKLADMGRWPAPLRPHSYQGGAGLKNKPDAYKLRLDRKLYCHNPTKTLFIFWSQTPHPYASSIILFSRQTPVCCCRGMNRNILYRSTSPFVKYIGLRECVADVYCYKLL